MMLHESRAGLAAEESRSESMTNEEMERILAYLRDTGQLDSQWYRT